MTTTLRQGRTERLPIRHAPGRAAFSPRAGNTRFAAPQALGLRFGVRTRRPKGTTARPPFRGQPVAANGTQHALSTRRDWLNRLWLSEEGRGRDPLPSQTERVDRVPFDVSHGRLDIVGYEGHSRVGL